MSGPLTLLRGLLDTSPSVMDYYDGKDYSPPVTERLSGLLASMVPTQPADVLRAPLAALLYSPEAQGMVISAKRGKWLPQHSDPLTGHKKAYLSDASARLKTENIGRNQFNDELLSLVFSGRKKLSEVLEHPELYSRYPEIKDMPVSGLLSMSASGAFDPKTKSLFVGGAKDPDFMKTILHEIQHRIQLLHGWPQGGNPNMFAANPDLYEAAKKRLGNSIEASVAAVKAKFPDFNQYADEGRLTPGVLASKEYAKLSELKKVRDSARAADDKFYQKYLRLGGEAEARATSSMWENEIRKGLQGAPRPHERYGNLIRMEPINQSSNPLEYYDVPLDELMKAAP